MPGLAVAADRWRRRLLAFLQPRRDQRAQVLERGLEQVGVRPHAAVEPQAVEQPPLALVGRPTGPAESTTAVRRAPCRGARRPARSGFPAATFPRPRAPPRRCRRTGESTFDTRRGPREPRLSSSGSDERQRARGQHREAVLLQRAPQRVALRPQIDRRLAQVDRARRSRRRERRGVVLVDLLEQPAQSCARSSSRSQNSRSASGPNISDNSRTRPESGSIL